MELSIGGGVKSSRSKGLQDFIAERFSYFGIGNFPSTVGRGQKINLSKAKVRFSGEGSDLSDSVKSLVSTVEKTAGLPRSQDFLLPRNDMSSKAAFTLAEVLITLGIIGVVAALTLPTLMANHRKQVVETRLAKFYSVINQAIKMAEVQYGDKNYWEPLGEYFVLDENGQPTTESIPLAWVNKYIMPYLNGAEVSAHERGGQAIIKFSDGSLAKFERASILFYPEAKNYTGKDKKEDAGIQYFLFFFNPSASSSEYALHYNKGIEPYAYGPASRNPDNVSILKNDSGFGCSKEIPRNARAYCTRLIQLNGWKIPKDYPLKF